MIEIHAWADLELPLWTVLIFLRFNGFVNSAFSPSIISASAFERLVSFCPVGDKNVQSELLGSANVRRQSCVVINFLQTATRAI